MSISSISYKVKMNDLFCMKIFEQSKYDASCFELQR